MDAEESELCALCGQIALGYGRGYGNERLCHHEDRDCYHRWTVYGQRPEKPGPEYPVGAEQCQKQRET